MEAIPIYCFWLCCLDKDSQNPKFSYVLIFVIHLHLQTLMSPYIQAWFLPTSSQSINKNSCRTNHFRSPWLRALDTISDKLNIHKRARNFEPSAVTEKIFSVLARFFFSIQVPSGHTFNCRRFLLLKVIGFFLYNGTLMVRECETTSNDYDLFSTIQLLDLHNHLLHSSFKVLR